MTAGGKPSSLRPMLGWIGEAASTYGWQAVWTYLVVVGMMAVEVASLMLAAMLLPGRRP